MGSGVLLALFGTQFTASLLLSDAANRMVLVALSAVYLTLSAIMLAVSWRRAGRLLREGTVAPLDRSRNGIAPRERDMARPAVSR